MAHLGNSGTYRIITTPGADVVAAGMDRQADQLLAHGFHAQAERLAHRAAAFRTASVLNPKGALAALMGETVA